MSDWDIVIVEFKETVFQDYIISEKGYKFLEEYTDERNHGFKHASISL